MRLYFIRHGQSANNALWASTGAEVGRSEDPELTEIGHQQAQLLADQIARLDSSAQPDELGGMPKRDYFGITHLYTSLMVRSVATATHLAKTMGLSLTAWPEVHECGGIYLEEENGTLSGLPGKPRAYFQEHYPHLLLPDTITEAGWWNRDFECDQDRPLRAQRVLESLLEKHGKTNDRVAVVSHGGFYFELARVIFQIRAPKSWFLMYNTAVSCFDFHEDGRTNLIYHNRTDHLPERLLT